ncbi:MAG: pirin family protein [Proteobacteria bacterium]|nr:pirin family protein [Pseudomonadota bacterium]
MNPTHTERSVTRIVQGQATSDGAGVRLFRVIGGQTLPELDPFLLLDEFVSDDPDDYIGGFPDHPHRGFETVTYMLAGRMRHGDNQGNSGLLQAGSVQWMTAGRGILHSEMPEQENGLMWGFQLWVNLPARSKMMAPRYQDIAPSDIPVVITPAGNRMKVIAGAFHGAQGPVAGIEAEPVYVDIEFGAGARETVALPGTHNAFVYCYQGAVTVGDADPTLVGHRRLAVLSAGPTVALTAGDEGAKVIVVAGKPFNEPVARYGPFVMNTREELMQAVDDLRNGRF